MHVIYTLMSESMGAALNTYTMDSMYEQTMKHDLWTSETNSKNALKWGGILIQHDVRGPGRGGGGWYVHAAERG